MKKKELAHEIGVTERSVTGYESGTQEPEPGTLAKISKTLRFPEAFFFGGDPEIPTPDIASFRSLSKMTSALRDSALGAGAIALLLNDWIEARFELPIPNVPDLGSDVRGLSTDVEGAEAAAEMLRAHWELGEQPIKNIITLLESKGVRVYSLAIDAKEVDAFSMWYGGRPFMFLNTFKSAERCRFDAAHELGHLVMHQHAHPQGPDLEREANAFASAFLMPRASVLSMAPRSVTIKSLIKYKKIWSVSVAALNYRLHNLGLSTEWTYRTLCIQIAQEGYRQNEPEPITHERSMVLEKIFGALRSEGVAKSSVADQLAISPEEINELTFGLMLNVLKGQVTGDSKRNAKSAANLRLVK